MKTQSRSLTCEKGLMLLVLVLAACSAAAEPYLGVNLGKYTWREYNPSLIGIGATTKVKISEWSPGVHGGYMFADWFGIEAAYQNYPSGSARTDDGVEVSMKGDAVGLYLRPTLRNGPGEVFLKLGVAFWDISSAVDTDLFQQPTIQQTGSDFAWGIGFALYASEHWKFGMEANGIEGKGAADLATWSLSAAYHF